MALPLLPIAGALIGGLTGYMSAPDDNKLGGTITGGLIGGLTGGIGKLAGGLMNAGKVASATEGLAGATGRVANSSWNPISLLKSAYTPDVLGLVNLGMDAAPLISDISNNDVGLKSFTGFAGTMAGTRFGGRELNKAGENLLKQKERLATAEYTVRAMNNNRVPQQLGLPSGRSPVNARKAQYGETGTFLERNPDANKFVDERISKLRDSYINDPRYSRQGYNMPIGMVTDFGLYSLTSGSGKPSDGLSQTQRQQQEFSNSPVSRYIQMTGAL